jgi:signal transduction histidine kinase
MMRRAGLARKYLLILVTLVASALLASGAIQIYASYNENKEALITLQREKASGAASRIETFVREIESQLAWTAQPVLVAPAAAIEQRRLDTGRLQKQVPAITEVSHLDAAGREQLRVSRLAMDVVGSRTDYSGDPKFQVAKTGKTYFGPVVFRKDSEPYMTIALRQSGGGVTVAEVNLKFIWDVVSQIKVGKAGLAYVVDRGGALIAHPDISLVLQKTSLAGLAQVKSVLANVPGDTEITIARSLKGRDVLTAHSVIAPLGWVVFVEQPLEEAFAPLRASVYRTAVLIAAGIVLAVVASAVLARRLARPIQALQASAAQIGAGELDHHITIRTGDELESLAEEFNRMTARLRESYVTLEQKVEDRTRELSEALEQQTATAEILRVISRSQTDVQPVFDTIVTSAVKLCDGRFGTLWQFDGELIHQVAQHNYTPEALEEVRRVYPSRPSRAHGSARAILERAVVHIPDLEADPEFQLGALSLSRAVGWRSGVFVPMLRKGTPIGAIAVTRATPGPFSDHAIELLKTFADQAVIAVENVRLFKELQARTTELTQSVEKLTALGEVSRAVSSTLDVETVLNTIVSRASQLAGAAGCSIFEYDQDDEQFELRATHNDDAEFVGALRAARLRKGEGLMGHAAEMREPVQIPDITQPGAYQSSLRDILIRFGYRALLSVPLLREDEIIGSLSFNRKTPGEFAPGVVDVLKTFATQSALAIQNARLFREIADKSTQLEAASRHKSEFLANMSHELRTPLNAIIGFSEVLSEGLFGEINEKQTEYLQDILESGRHLLSLINDILDLSKIEAGHMELELADFQLPQAIDNALVLVRERAMRRGLTLEQSIDARLGEIQGDERKVKQALLNLLSNAIKFTPEGGRVGVQAKRVGDHVEIAVSDTGIGIAPEDQQAVFEEFRQVGTAERKAEGTGLGLALTRKFIELHGGRIWVQSQVGAGSTFTFTLPVRHGE